MRFSLAIIFLSLTHSWAFSVPGTTQPSITHRGSCPVSSSRRALVCRGGVTPAVALADALRAGPGAVPALTGLAGATLLPLTMYRQGYSFSVGYGTSVAVMAAALIKTFAASPIGSVGGALAASALFYGVRLAAHLLLRELTVPSIKERILAFDKTPRAKRLPLVASVALFYAMMVSPALYALRAPPAVGTVAHCIAKCGASMAWAGALVEAVADAQKLLKKRAVAAEGHGENYATWRGPCAGVYARCRHPNYLGEVLFWAGLLVGGAPSFGRAPVPWVAGGLGLFGIVSIMLGATARLEKKQAEKYGGQPNYDAYVEGSNALTLKLFA